MTLSVVYETAWTCNFNGLYAATGCEFVSSGHGCIHFNMGQQPSYLSTVIPFRVSRSDQSEMRTPDNSPPKKIFMWVNMNS